MNTQHLTGTWVSQDDVLSAFKAAQSKPTHTEDDLLTAINRCCPTRAIVIGATGAQAHMTVHSKDESGNPSKMGPFAIAL